MPSVEENLVYWNDEYPWPFKGDEWSRDWGDPSTQWYGTILPRIRHFLPSSSILEIGCGQGRWTEFLARNCKSLSAIDISPKCIAICRKRFAHLEHITFYPCDGASMPTIADHSVDFIFSFDSLVLANPETIRAYLSEAKRVLAPKGTAFLHHSNLAAYSGTVEAQKERDLYWRDPEVDAELVRELALECGLGIIAQETIRWGTNTILLDAFSMLSSGEYRLSISPKVFENHDFSLEIEAARKISHLYRPPLQKHQQRERHPHEE